MTVPANLVAPLLSQGIVINLTVNSNAYNIRTAALAAGWDGVSPVTVNVTNSATHRATSTGNYALDTDVSYPAGSRINIVNNAALVGAGGASGGYPGTNGTPGGHAVLLRSSCPWSFVNTSNIVGGGGGGGWGGGKHDASGDAWHYPTAGGAGGYSVVASTNGTFTNSGVVGGGGAGGTGGNGFYAGDASGGGGGGGAGEGGAGSANTAYCPATNGSAGSITAGGNGGAGSDCSGGANPGTAGANGGSMGNGYCLWGKAYVNSGAGITGTTYGPQA